MAAARLYRGEPSPRWSSMASWSLLSLLPDVDVVGFALGIDYADPWGHRGATHSFFFSAALGLSIGFAARRFKQPVIRTALFASLVLGSHGVLDAMTDGGLGCALFWPVDFTRHFAPWRPIPVAPIGADFFSSGGAAVALIELVLFGPLLVYALGFPRIATKRVAAASLLVPWALSVWLIGSSDRMREAIVGFVLREDTAYASGFSEAAFRRVTPGQSETDVRRLLGAPWAETWFYPPRDQPFEPASTTSAASRSPDCFAVRFEGGAVLSAREFEPCKRLGIGPGVGSGEVDRRLGSPRERCWQYTWSPGGQPFRLRAVCFVEGSVAMTIRQWN